MYFNNNTSILILLIINIIMILISIYFIVVNWKSKVDSEEPDDVLLHMSSETETLLRVLNNFLIYDKNTTFISINQLSTKNSYDNGIDKFNLTDNIELILSDFNNYKNHFIQGFTEIKENSNYLSHKLSTSIPLSQPVKLIGENGNVAYLIYFSRLSDNKKFYFIQITQTFAGYVKRPNSYKAISELLQYIIKNYPGEYIITGDFNVQGHEKVFKNYLSTDDYHIFDAYNYATCNDNEGVASPDGIVISKKLYPRVDFFIDFYNGNSFQHFLIGAKMYMNGNGTNITISTKFKNFLNVLKTNHGKRDYFIDNPGVFNKDDILYTGDINNIKTTPLIKSNIITYMNKTTTLKLDKIE